MKYSLDNGYKLHAAHLWLSTGAMSKDVEKQIQDVVINYDEEKMEINQLLKEAYIYVCPNCNHHAFLDHDEGDEIQCSSCLKYAVIDE